jgi:hypothetical protein
MKEYKGEFYYPKFPENLVSGVLTVDENRNIGLELLGSLSDFFGSTRSAGTTIYGNLFNGKKATLLSCSNKNFEIRFGVSQLEQFKATLLLIGTHVLSEDEPFFNEITVDIDHLAEWIGITGSRLSFQDGFKNLTFKYNAPENIEFPINGDLVGTFFFRQTFPIQARDFKLEERTFFSISSINAKSLINMISFIRDFRKLLSFFIGTKTKINQLVLTSPNETIELINPTTDKIHFEEIHLFFNDQDDNLNNSVIDDFPIKYADIINVFPEVLSNWYDQKQVDLVPISNILLECLASKSVYDDNQFLSAFQGVEAFHRRFLQDTAALKVTHKAYMKSILNFIDDPDLTAKLTAQLTFAYEMTAKQRFAEIIPKLVLIMPNITEQQIEIWIKEMVNSRNYLTHLDPSGLKKKASSRKLMHYTELLKATLSFLIMFRIGIPPEFMKGIEMKYRHSIEYLIKNTEIVPS